MDQLDQLEASELDSNLESNSRDDSSSNIESNASFGADIIPPQSRSPSPSLEPSSITSKTGIRHSIGARIQALTCLELGTPIFQIEAKTSIKKSQIYSLRKKALARGWNPTISTIIETYHVDDSFRSRRSKISQELIDLIIGIVTKNSTTRSWSYIRVAYEASLKSDTKVSSTIV